MDTVIESTSRDTTTPDLPARKPYTPPVLTDFGSLVEKTQGAIGAGGDIGIYS